MPSWATPSVFWQMHHKYLGFREFAKYVEWGKFADSVGHPKAKGVSASGGLHPWPPDQGALPLDPVWGSAPIPRVISSRSSLAMCVHPTFLTWRRPWQRVGDDNWRSMCHATTLWTKCSGVRQTAPQETVRPLLSLHAIYSSNHLQISSVVVQLLNTVTQLEVAGHMA